MLVAWMLAQFAAIGILLAGMQFGFLTVGGVLLALGLTGARLVRDGGSGVRTGRPDGPSSGRT